MFSFLVCVNIYFLFHFSAAKPTSFTLPCTQTSLYQSPQISQANKSLFVTEGVQGSCLYGILSSNRKLKQKNHLQKT